MKSIRGMIILLCFSLNLKSVANELNLYVGLDGWRHDTGADSTADPGWNIGAEYLFTIKEDTFYLGGGAEYKSKVKGLDGYKNYDYEKTAPVDYNLMLVYIKGKLHLCCLGFYLHSRLGYSYNDNGDSPAENGLYISAGLGFEFTRVYIEVAYELFDINDNGESFNNGTMQMVGIKTGYKF